MPSRRPSHSDLFTPPDHLTITGGQFVWMGWSSTLLAYIVVLNLYEEYIDRVVISSFTVSILTSVVLLALLVATVQLQHRS